jgi:ABC-type uncharacterized transport system substrate-binding protein
MRLRAISALFAGLLATGCTLTDDSPITPKRVTRDAAVSRPRVAILVSQPIPPYTEVAKRLKQHLGERATVYDLKQVRDGSYHAGDKSLQLVTIGLDASRITEHLHHQQIFCQVFNYSGRGLSGPHSKGVSMIPGINKTFAAWKAISPGLHDVAVISGPGQQALLLPAIDAAAEQGITLHHLAVSNDKEYQYAFKREAARVQGYWLIPDNRVLSVETLRDVMNFSVRNGKQVVVFNDDLLSLGGLLSVRSDYDDIAEKVLLRLKQAEGHDEIPGPELLPLEEVVLNINEVMAQRLNLTIPKQYREYADVQASP